MKLKKANLILILLITFGAFVSVMSASTLAVEEGYIYQQFRGFTDEKELIDSVTHALTPGDVRMRSTADDHIRPLSTEEECPPDSYARNCGGSPCQCDCYNPTLEAYVGFRQCKLGDSLERSTTLTKDYTGTGAFHLEKEGITLDCGGYTLDGGGVYSSKKGVTIKNCVIVNGYGIDLSMSTGCIITGNTISNATYNGISLSYSSYNTLTSNTANNNECGIYATSSSYNTFTSNTANNNSKHGIILNGDHNTLTSNTANNNNWCGITLAMGGDHNTLTSNIVNNNSGRGITLDGDHNTLTNNIVSDNSEYGIYLERNSNNNTIYNNYFNSMKNALDYENNIWNIIKTPGTNIVGGPYLGGNYWSDYEGTDTDGDGLGDTLLPYTCSGGIKNGGDWLPLVVPPVHNLNTLESFATIQAAIDDEDTKDGHTIAVDPDYTEAETRENVVVNKKLTIKSSSGNLADTSIQALNPNEPVATIVVDGVEIQGFTIKDATGEWGIWTDEGVVIRDAKVTNNGKGGIFSVKGSVAANNIEVTRNGGPGIVASATIIPSSDTLILENIKVRNNKGDGIGTIGPHLFIIGSSNEITHNGGKGTFALSGDVTIEGTTEIHDNGGWGILALGAVRIHDGAMSSINKNGKGGIFGGEGVSLPPNFVVEDNGGAGIACGGWGTLHLKNIKVRNNKGDGIGALTLNGDLVIKGSSTEITNNAGWGIQSGAGKAEIRNATITNNTAGGIRLFSSENGTITGNTVSNNGKYGICLFTSKGNTIYNNSFNNPNNAVDDGTNIWNIAKTAGTNIVGGPYLGGNYWSDYEGTDADGDGLGDTPYDIPGGTNKDNLPLVLKPKISIYTDKFVYNPGDTMITTLCFKNPTDSTVDTYFLWYLYLPDYDYWVPVMTTSFTLPSGFDESYDIPLHIDEWASVGFNAAWYVALRDTTPPYEIISQDTAEWRYVPPTASAETPKLPEEIAEQITKSVEIERVELPY